MLLTAGLRGGKPQASATYQTLTDVESFFRELADDDAISTPIKYDKLSPVAAAHRIYTSSLAVLPWMIRRKVGDVREEPSHYLDTLLKLRSNSYMSAYMARKAILSQAYWYGAGYAYIERDGIGRVKSIIPLPSCGHQVYKDDAMGVIWHSFNIASEVPYSEKLQRKFTESELLIHRFESYNGLMGVGVLDLAKETMATDKAAQKYANKFYTNGARVSGIVQVDGELNNDARDTVRDDFERMAHGMDNAFRVAVLDLGMKYTPLGISQKDAQYIEGRSFTVEEISRFTGIPAYKMQVGKQSYQSNQQQQIDFVQNTLMGSIVQMEQEWTYKLLTRSDIENGFYLKQNTAMALRGDDDARSNYYQRLFGVGAMSPDDIRSYEDRSPLPDGAGRTYWISKNYDTITRMVKGGDDT